MSILSNHYPEVLDELNSQDDGCDHRGRLPVPPRQSPPTKRERQEMAWQEFLAEQDRRDYDALLADPAYHVWVDQQATDYAAVTGGEAK